MAGSFLAGLDRHNQRIDDDASLPLRQHLDGIEVDLKGIKSLLPRRSDSSAPNSMEPISSEETTAMTEPDSRMPAYIWQAAVSSPAIA